MRRAVSSSESASTGRDSERAVAGRLAGCGRECGAPATGAASVRPGVADVSGSSALVAAHWLSSGVIASTRQPVASRTNVNLAGSVKALGAAPLVPATLTVSVASTVACWSALFTL